MGFQILKAIKSIIVKYNEHIVRNLNKFFSIDVLTLLSAQSS